MGMHLCVFEVDPPTGGDGVRGGVARYPPPILAPNNLLISNLAGKPSTRKNGLGIISGGGNWEQSVKSWCAFGKQHILKKLGTSARSSNTDKATLQNIVSSMTNPQVVSHPCTNPTRKCSHMTNMNKLDPKWQQLHMGIALWQGSLIKRSVTVTETSAFNMSALQCPVQMSNF